MPNIVTIPDTFDRIVVLGREDFKDIGGKGLKLMEEVGEFAETINHAIGNLPHKKMKESPFGEAADVIQCVIVLLAATFPKMTPDEITAEVAKQLDLKTDKYEDKVIKRFRNPPK